MWSICSDMRSDISAGVGAETSCLLVLTVLGGLSASHQLLHCELCRTNVNLPLSCGDFKLEQSREGRELNKRMTGCEKNVWNWYNPTVLSSPHLGMHDLGLHHDPHPFFFVLFCFVFFFPCVISCTCNELRYCCDLFVKQAVLCVCA